MQKIRGSIITLVWVVLVGVTFLILTVATKWGAGLTADSVSYIEESRKMFSPDGFAKLDNHFPPIYPLLIAIINLVINNFLISIRILQVLVSCLITLSAGLICFKQTNRSHVHAIMGMFLMALSYPLIVVNSMAWSEAVFFLLSLSGGYFFCDYLNVSNKRNLVFAAVLIGLSFLTRYVGITLICSGCLALIFFNTSWRKRISDIMIFGLVSIFPVVIWLGKGTLAINQIADRTIQFHSISPKKLADGKIIVGEWFFILNGNIWMILTVLGALIGMYICKRLAADRRVQEFDISDFTAIFIPFYALFLFFSISFIDSHTPLNNRILSPLYLFFIVSSPIVLYKIAQSGLLNKKVVFIFYILLITLTISNIPRTNRWIAQVATHGNGFASMFWANSPTISILKQFPKDYPIYTNSQEPIKIYLNRESKLIPMLEDPVTRQNNDRFEAEVLEMSKAVKGEKGVIVWFHNITWKPYLPKIDSLINKLDGTPVHYRLVNKKDGTSIYPAAKDGLVISLE